MVLNYNDYGVTELFGDSYIIIENDSMMPNYKKGDLLVVAKRNNDTIKKGDNIFFYETDMKKKEVVISLASVSDVRKITDTETTFTVVGNEDYSSEYVIGSANDTTVFHGLGSILSLLESRWVFLLLIILPVLFIFLYVVYEFILEFKRALKEVN